MRAAGRAFLWSVAASMALAMAPPAQCEERAASRDEAEEAATRHGPEIEPLRPVGPRRDLTDPYAPRPVIDRPGLHRTPARRTRLGTRVPRPGARGVR